MGTREVVLTAADVAFLCLVLTPLLFGVSAGYVLGRRGAGPGLALLGFLVCTAGVTQIPARVLAAWGAAGAGNLSGATFLLAGMAGVWMLLGYASGRLTREHVLVLGWVGTRILLTCGVAGVCLSSLAFNLPLMAWQGTSRHDLGQAAIVWSGYLVPLLLVVFELGPASTVQVFRNLRTAILKLLTIIGILSVGVQLATGELIEALLWWIPADPPMAYKILQPLVFGPVLFMMLRGVPARADASLLSAGSRRHLGIRLSKLDGGQPPPLTDEQLPQFQLPAGWEHRQPQPGVTAIWCMAPRARGRSRRSRSLLTVQAAQMKDESLSDPERLRSHTQENLIAWRVVSTLADAIGTRHGEKSHEVKAEVAGGQFISLIWFVKRHIAYAYTWESPDVNEFVTRLPEVGLFVDSTGFTPMAAPAAPEGENV